VADAECHETAPKDFLSAAKVWRAMWPEFFAQK
jgi:hypothetical protein